MKPKVQPIVTYVAAARRTGAGRPVVFHITRDNRVALCGRPLGVDLYVWGATQPPAAKLQCRACRQRSRV